MDRDAPRGPDAAGRAGDGARRPRVRFAAGEWLRTEISAKFTAEGVERRAVGGGARVDEQWTDAAGDFLSRWRTPTADPKAQEARLRAASHGAIGSLRRRMAATGVTATGIQKRFGAVEVLHDIDLDVAPGRSSPCSGRRAAARRRCCGSSPGSSGPTPARCASTSGS